MHSCSAFLKVTLSKGAYLPIYIFYKHTHTNSLLSLSRCYSSSVIAQYRFSGGLDDILPDL